MKESGQRRIGTRAVRGRGARAAWAGRVAVALGVGGWRPAAWAAEVAGAVGGAGAAPVGHSVTLHSPLGPVWGWTLVGAMFAIVALLAAYALRHYGFSLNRVFGQQRHPFASIVSADWPRVTIFVAAHNEEAVIEDCLVNLMGVDYPADRMTVVPMNDRSTDRTREIIDAVVERFPGRIRPFHRTGGKPGKAAALKDATETVDTDFIIVFDADYLPSRGLIRRLMAPFFDPEVGAVMGRVVPQNCGANLLTRLLDLERSGGYQVDQQARMNLGLVPQYGGTVGGIRLAALRSVGGWHDDVLAEDTDLTYRLLLGGWKTVYQNRAECYEEVPQNWGVRVRQIKRWAKGHNQAMWRHTLGVLAARHLSRRERLDGALLLGVYIMAPVLMLGWVISLLLYFTVALHWIAPALVVMGFMTHGALGNFAAFFEIAAATHMDRSGHRIRLLAFNWLGFLVSAVAIARGALEQVLLDRIGKTQFKWDKTVRYRTASAAAGVAAGVAGQPRAGA